MCVRIRGSGSGSAPKCHGSPTLASTPQSTYTQRVPQLELGPPPLSPASQCAPSPWTKWVGEGVGRCSSPFHKHCPESAFAISFLGPEPDVAFYLVFKTAGLKPDTFQRRIQKQPWSGLFGGFNLIFYVLQPVRFFFASWEKVENFRRTEVFLFLHAHWYCYNIPYGTYISSQVFFCVWYSFEIILAFWIGWLTP